MRREDLLAIFRAGIEAVRPDQALLANLRLADGKLIFGDRSYDLARGRVIVVGAGKGAAPMARSIEQLLGGKIDKGLVAVKYGHTLPLQKIEIVEAAHPSPDHNGEQAAVRMLELASEAREGDLLICLFTGGASALLPAPAHGLSLADLQETTAALLASGATIHEMNAIRKHLSRLAGGQLAKTANGADVLAVIVSDVVGDELGVIASGPTAPDDSTWQDCAAILKKYDLAGRIPQRVTQLIQAGAQGKLAETPKAGDAFFGNVSNVIVASNRHALEAAAREAADLGYEVRIEKKPLGGEARDAARELVAKARAIAGQLAHGAKPVCLLAGGETTVTLQGKGIGGRNQEMALTAAIELENFPQVSALFAGTDGTDGPTDAAGGFAFADSVAKMGGRAREYLAENDSYHALKRASDLLVTGPTLTNVMDLAILICEGPDAPQSGSI